MSHKRIVLFLLILSFSIFSQGQAQDKIDSLLALDLDDYPDTVVLEVYNKLATNYDDPQYKEKYANLLLAKAREFDPVWKMRAYLQLGNAKKLLANYEEALANYFKALEVAKGLTYTEEGMINITIAGAYKAAEDYNNAYQYYQNAKQSYLKSRLPKLHDSIYLAGVYINMGDMFLIQKNYDSALDHFEKAKYLVKQVKYDYYLAVIRGNIAIVYAALGQDESANEEITRSIEYLGKEGAWNTVVEFLIYMADIYKDNKNNEKALEYISKTYELAKEYGLKKQIQESCFRLYELMQEEGDYRAALEYHKEYIVYKDSVLDKETIRKMADLRTEYEVGQKQIEVDLLKAKQKGFFFAVFFLVLLLLLIGTLAYVFIVRNKEKREANKLLTEQKQQLEAQHKKLELLNKTKDRFFSIISHDLRSPVNAFKGLSSLIKFSVDNKQYDELHEITGRITDASDKLSLLLDNLLEWAINQQGQLLYTPREVNLKELVNEIVPIFDNMAQAKEIILKVDANDDIIIWAEVNSIKTVLRNLISNAIKFTENGGEVVVSATRDTDKALLEVKDTGIGIPKEKLDSLFQLKEKKSTWGTDGERGLGLGLRLAYEFTEMNKGDIKVESKEGLGTTFRVEIPIYKKVF